MPAAVLDLGADGAKIEHYRKLDAKDVYVLRVDWRQPFQCKVRIRHTQLQKLADASGPAIFHTGLAFIGLAESSLVVIDSILIDEVKRQVVEWEANLTGTRRDRLPSFGQDASRPTLPVAFTWHRLVAGRWVTVSTRDPNQPVDGFALPDDESPAQVELLRKAYEFYDDEDRAMLRMMAHLVIAGRTRTLT